MKYIKNFNKDGYTRVEMNPQIYRELAKKKMSDSTLQYIEKLIQPLADHFGLRSDGYEYSVEYWDEKTFNIPTRIHIFEVEDEWFYIISFYKYENICHKCDQLDGLINCINDRYGQADKKII